MVVSVYSRNPQCGILNGFSLFKLFPSISDNQPEVLSIVLFRSVVQDSRAKGKWVMA